MDIFVDTSVIVPFLIETPATSAVRDFFNANQGTFHICSMVCQETLFIGLRLIAAERLNIHSYFDLRSYIIDNGYSFAEDFYHKTSELFYQMVIHPDSADYCRIMELMKDFCLFPADAVIAATCMEYNITAFASRDKDYSRITSLKMYSFE